MELKKENEVILFKDGELELQVSLSQDKETVWLSSNQMALLFERDEKTIRKHVNNIFKDNEVDFNNNTQKMRVDGVKQLVVFYSLDVILAVGYRVNSSRGILFRKWANSVLKQYIVNGYAINKKRLEALEKTVSIQTKMLAHTLNLEESEVLQAVNQYTNALLLLDKYDHQTLNKPSGNKDVYRITYKECKNLVSKMEDSFKSSVFGHEKEPGQVEGILAAVYQNVFGQEVYPSVEEKAAKSFVFYDKRSSL